MAPPKLASFEQLSGNISAKNGTIYAFFVADAYSNISVIETHIMLKWDMEKTISD
jgi:hypothetical protein